MRLARRGKRLRIEGPDVPEGPGDRTGGAPEEPDGPIVDMEMRDGGWRQKRKWWQRKPKIEQATLSTLTYDGERYILRRKIVPKADLPREAVHITGVKGEWFLDSVDRDGRDDLKVKDDPAYKTADAVDLYLYAVNNAISDALMIKAKGAPTDIKRILIYVMIAAVAVCVAWIFIGPMLRRLPIETFGNRRKPFYTVTCLIISWLAGLTISSTVRRPHWSVSR